VVGLVALPDFFVIGVPKAGTTALHSALAGHPELCMSRVKEPKFFLCEDGRPMPWSGPGDAHSSQKWICDREVYESLFEGNEDLLRGESTPFYLYDIAAHDRIARLVPDAKFVVVLRDPVDRAHSNWLHLWYDGLETERDFVTACSLEVKRISDGWGPFWHYLNLGRYGEQMQHLLTRFARKQILIVKYRDLVDGPAQVIDRICCFLGVEPGLVSSIPMENTPAYVADAFRPRRSGRVMRIGSNVGALLPPEMRREVSEPIVHELQRNTRPRPRITPEDRQMLVAGFEEDIRLLERFTRLDFSDWLTAESSVAIRSRIGRASRPVIDTPYHSVSNAV
jgi:hypothetical protein